MTSATRLTERRLQQTNPPKKDSKLTSWSASVLSIVALCAALLWFYGWRYRSAYFGEFGFDAAMFPLDWPSTVAYGGLVSLMPAFWGCVYALCISLVIALTLEAIPEAWVTKWSQPSKSKKSRAYDFFASMFFLSAVVLTGLVLWAIFGVVSPSVTGKENARNALTGYAKALCGDGKDTSTREPAVRIQRRVLLKDGKEGVALDEGFEVACTEKYCAIVIMDPKDKSWHSRLVPMDRVITMDVYMRSERAIGCPPSPP